MNSPVQAAGASQDQANALYWNSSDTVDQLAQRLGMSRTTLYNSIQPLPVGASCPDCGEPLVFANRSSRTAGKATCSACGTETEVDETTAVGASAGDEANAAPQSEATAGESRDEQQKGRLEQWKEDLAAVAPERAAMIGGAAALGVAVGAVAAKIARKKK